MKPTDNQLAAARASFERAVTFMHAGDFSMAEQICRNSLAEFPRDANLLCLLGAALIKQNRPEDAEHTLHRASTMYPNFDRAHEGLAEAYVMQGNLRAALASIDEAINLAPTNENLRVMRGRILLGMGRDNDASIEFEKSFKQTPFREDLVKGLQFQRMGNLQEAEKVYRSVLQQDPQNVDALRLLAGIATRAKQWNDAEVLLKKALKIAPDYVQGWMDLGLTYQEQDRIEDALQALDKAHALEPERANPLTAAGTALGLAGRHEEAIDKYRQSLRINRTSALALTGIGHVLKTIGQQQEAIDSYRACIKHNATHGEAYWSLANLKTFQFTDDEVNAMRKHAENTELEDEPRVNFLFALGKAHEDRKDYDSAFDYYARGNELRRKSENYDPVHTIDQHDLFISTFTAKLFEQHPGSGYVGDTPIFIVGLPRSGSTLLEQILASHSQVEGTHELPELGRTARTIGQNSNEKLTYPAAAAKCSDAELAELGEAYIDRTRRHRSDMLPFFTDKLPNNFAHVGLIHLILPDAKIIDARRHPIDSCLGGFKQLFARGQPFTYDLYEIGEFYLEYNRLMRHWDDVLPGKVLRVNYEDVVADLDRQVERILDHCGLPFEDGCLQFWQTERAVKTASSEQVRKPIYSSSVDLWRRYEKHLDPLVEVLEPLLLEMPPKRRPSSLQSQ